MECINPIIAITKHRLRLLMRYYWLDPSLFVSVSGSARGLQVLLYLYQCRPGEDGPQCDHICRDRGSGEAQVWPGTDQSQPSIRSHWPIRTGAAQVFLHTSVGVVISLRAGARGRTQPIITHHTHRAWSSHQASKQSAKHRAVATKICFNCQPPVQQ